MAGLANGDGGKTMSQADAVMNQAAMANAMTPRATTEPELAAGEPACWSARPLMQLVR
jgi:hypothetical protein